jgi:flagellar assembly protein FliH
MARVIKAEEVNTVGAAKAAVLNLKDLAAQARQIVLDARREAAGMLARTRAQAKETRQEAARAGRAQGFEEGRAQGLAQGLQEAGALAQSQADAQSAELAALAKKIVEELASAREQQQARMQRDMLEFSLQLAAKIVGQVAVSDIAAARGNLTKVLELAGQNSEIVVKVNPGQLRRLREHYNELVEALGLTGQMKLVGDDEISPGGVKLVSRSGEIDATIETQLANVAQSLVGGIGNLFEPALPAESYVPEATCMAQGGKELLA